MPESKASVREYFESKPFVDDVGTTAYGLLISLHHDAPPATFGRLLSERGWVVDYLDWGNRLFHVAPLKHEVADDA